MHLLGTGRLRTFVTRAAGGFSVFDDLPLTRHVSDEAASGPLAYVRDLGTGRYWTTGLVPGAPAADHFEGRFEPGGAAFRRRDGFVETTLRVAVSPENDVEVRCIGLTNHGDAPLRLEVTTYLEVVLGDAGGGSRAAPATPGIRTDAVPGLQALVAERHLHSAGAPLTIAHTLVPDDSPPGEATYETDRGRFLGRTRSVGRPVALITDAPLSGTTGARRDPVLAIRRILTVEPGQTRTLTATLGAGPTREAALTAVFAGLSGARSRRAFEQAARAAGPGEVTTFSDPSAYEPPPRTATRVGR